MKKLSKPIRVALLGILSTILSFIFCIAASTEFMGMGVWFVMPSVFMGLVGIMSFIYIVMVNFEIDL